MTAIVLTEDQQAAYQAIVGFLSNPTSRTFVLKGFAGTGKSTLVNTFLGNLESTLKTVKFLTQTDQFWEVQLTATTHKACEALEAITGRSVKTIQSFLGLVVDTNYQTRKTSLVLKSNTKIIKNHIILIDEASQVDKDLQTKIKERTNNCKVIYIGDPAQLTPVKTNYAPVFMAGYPEVQLNEVVRQAKGNPIIDLATAFRNTVNTGEFFSFRPDGEHIRHMPRDVFGDMLKEEFTRPGWNTSSAKVLAFTNKKVIEFNETIRSFVQGLPELQIGDHAVCNEYINYSRNGKSCNLKTEQTVLITDLSPAIGFGVHGWLVQMNGIQEAFMPKTRESKQALLRKFRQEEKWDEIHIVETSWIDLRAVYACTVHKSQGSTYDKVFIDLDDISKCNDGNTIARMMYVAVSRARNNVYLTGDFVKSH